LRSRFDDAHQFHSARHAIIQRLAESDPANAEWQRDLWVSHWLFAKVLEQQGSNEAMRYWRQPHDTLASMVKNALFIAPEAYSSWSVYELM
jgi:hypothetical protein